MKRYLIILISTLSLAAQPGSEESAKHAVGAYLSMAKGITPEEVTVSKLEIKDDLATAQADIPGKTCSVRLRKDDTDTENGWEIAGYSCKANS